MEETQIEEEDYQVVIPPPYEGGPPEAPPTKRTTPKAPASLSFITFFPTGNPSHYLSSSAAQRLSICPRQHRAGVPRPLPHAAPNSTNEGARLDFEAKSRDPKERQTGV